MMKRKMKLIVASVAMIVGGLSANQGMASTLSINPAQLLQLPNDQFNITVDGVFDQKYTGGGFRITWDPNVIILTTAPDWSPAMTGSGVTSIINRIDDPITPIDPTNPPTNYIDAVFSGCSPFSCPNVGGDAGNPVSMTVLDNITFQVVATNPSTSDIALGLSPLAGTWFDANLAPVAVPTMSGATLTVSSVSAVPLPAAAWLMGSGLLGLLGFSRKRREVAAA